MATAYLIAALLLGSSEGKAIEVPPRQVVTAPVATKTSKQVIANAFDALPVFLTQPPYARVLKARQVLSDPPIFLTDGTQLESLPASICGFASGDPGRLLTCSLGGTCASAGTRLCCAQGNLCEPEVFTTCSDTYVTDYDVYYSYTDVDSTLYCNLDAGLGCRTFLVGDLTWRGCKQTILPLTVSYWPQQQFIDYFQGYTIRWDAYWDVKAINTTSTSGSLLDQFKAGSPSCAKNITDQCPELAVALQACYVYPLSVTCVCTAIASIQCPGLCLEGKQPNDYLNYIMPICQDIQIDVSSLNNATDQFTNTSSRGGSTEFVKAWSDYPNISQVANLRLFPWAWHVEYNASELVDHPKNGTAQSPIKCSSARATLLSFAAINFAVFVASIVVANRKFVYLFTRCCTEKDQGGKWWPASALLSVAINLSSNFVNATLIKSSPGYNHVPLMPLVLLWSTRPRLAWMVLLLALFTMRTKLDHTLYLDSAVASLLAEVILQAIASVFMVITINHARINKFLLLGHLKSTPHGSDALLMYAGSLLWVVSIGFAFFSAFITFTPVATILKGAIAKIHQMPSTCARKIRNLLTKTRGPVDTNPVVAQNRISATGDSDENSYYQTTTVATRDGTRRTNEENHPSNPDGRVPPETDNNPRLNFTHHPVNSVLQNLRDNRERYLRQMGFPSGTTEVFVTMFLFLLLPWAAQWLFWIGFIRASGNLYCPPDIWTLSGVWTGFSALGVFFGAF